MQLCAFVFLEDISAELPRYEETYLMDWERSMEWNSTAR